MVISIDIFHHGTEIWPSIKQKLAGANAAVGSNSSGGPGGTTAWIMIVLSGSNAT